MAGRRPAKTTSKHGFCCFHFFFFFFANVCRCLLVFVYIFFEWLYCLCLCVCAVGATIYALGMCTRTRTCVFVSKAAPLTAQGSWFDQWPAHRQHFCFLDCQQALRSCRLVSVSSFFNRAVFASSWSRRRWHSSRRPSNHLVFARHLASDRMYLCPANGITLMQSEWP